MFHSDRRDSERNACVLSAKKITLGTKVHDATAESKTKRPFPDAHLSVDACPASREVPFNRAYPLETSFFRTL